nr:zinc finger, CCHC-type [Tanacetum cinerariifolium]
KSPYDNKWAKKAQGKGGLSKPTLASPLREIVRKLKAFEERIKLQKEGQVKSQENLLFAHGEHSRKGRRFSKRRATHSGKKLIFLLVDDCTRFMWAYFLTSKDQAFSTFKEFRQQIKMEMRMKLRTLRTDRGGEFTSNEFTKYCKENGIARQLTAPYSPQQNGVLERRNITVLSTTRSMMKAMKLPLTFWAEAVKHAIYILNRVPTIALVDKTPYEALYNRKPNLENLRIFGCTTYAKITIPHLKKLDDRSIPMIYLGVEEGSKSCRLYDPKGNRKHVSRDVSFMVEGVDNENPTPVNTENNDNTYQEQEPITDPDLPITLPAYTYNLNSEEEEEATISSLMNSENRFDDTPV